MAGVAGVRRGRPSPLTTERPTSTSLDIYLDIYLDTNLDRSTTMNDTSTPDQAVGDPTAPHAPAAAVTPFGNPNGDAPAVPATPARQWTIEDILATAKTPEKHARVCLRGDLQAEHDQILAELATLVDAQGKVVEDDERPADEQSKGDRAVELMVRLEVVRAQMAKAMWFPLFRGLTTDALADFNKLHRPKPRNDGQDPDLSEYNTLLVAECSIASIHGPKLSADDVRALRARLGSRAMGSLVGTAHEVCTTGGADVPKLPGSLAGLKQQ